MCLIQQFPTNFGAEHRADKAQRAEAEEAEEQEEGQVLSADASQNAVWLLSNLMPFVPKIAVAIAHYHEHANVVSRCMCVVHHVRPMLCVYICVCVCVSCSNV